MKLFGKSLLSPPASIGVSIGTAGLVYAIYSLTVPNIGTIHATDAHDLNIEKARKKAAISAGVAAAAIAMLSQDLNPWIIGGGAVIVSDVFVRHANVTSPDTGKVVASEYGTNVQSQPYYGANSQ